MSDANNAQIAIVVLMFSLSATTWWMWWRRWKTLRIRLAARKTTATPVWEHTRPFVLSLALIGFAPALRFDAGPGESKPVTMEHVRFGCLERTILVAVLIGLLTGFVARAARDFGAHSGELAATSAGRSGDGSRQFSAVLLLMTATALLGLRRAEEKNALLRLLDADRSFATLAWVLLAAVVLAPLNRGVCSFESSCWDGSKHRRPRRTQSAFRRWRLHSSTGRSTELRCCRSRCCSAACTIASSGTCRCPSRTRFSTSGTSR